MTAGRRGASLSAGIEGDTGTLSLAEVCLKLSISRATARNWIRLGKISPLAGGRSPRFDRAYIEEMEKQLKSGENHRLKNRRNKKSIMGRSLYRDYIVHEGNQQTVAGILESGAELSPAEIRTVLANFAVQLYLQSRGQRPSGFVLQDFLECALPEDEHEPADCGAAGDDAAGGNVAGDDAAGDDAAGGNVAGDDAAGGNVAGSSESLDSSEPAGRGGPMAGRGSLEYRKFSALLEYQKFSALIRELLGGSGAETAAAAAARLRKLETAGAANQHETEEPPFLRIMEKTLTFVPGEDTLGFVYISLRDVSQRKITGAYYTPAAVVNRLLSELQSDVRLDGKTVCDPCCGTGNFLMELAARGVEAENLYGQDSDALSVQLLRINIALLCPGAAEELLKSHFICGNTLFHTFLDKFDIILGNPPWGYAFSAEETARLRKIYRTAEGKGLESFDLFVERSLSMLDDGGTLAFILPESVLTVTAHLPVRRMLLEQASFRFVSYLGNVFSGVQCPAIVLGVRRGGCGETAGCRVTGEIGGQKLDYVVMGQRELDGGVFSFNITDEEEDCIRAMDRAPGAKYLAGNAVFALGIVTGDNKEKVRREAGDGFEVVLKGSDISRYAVHPSGNYLKFQPEQFQQVAPEEYYRAPEKLLYRFISEVPVFAYDDRQMLTLNSCNILIPKIAGMEMKYVLAVLNSSAAAFYLGKRFNSVKLLRSHIEQLPVPAADAAAQREIVELVDAVMSAAGKAADAVKNGDTRGETADAVKSTDTGEETVDTVKSADTGEETADTVKSADTAGEPDGAAGGLESLYEALDNRIMDLYGLDGKKRRVIAAALAGKSRFLR